jgi:signal transduction histidine kinase
LLGEHPFFGSLQLLPSHYVFIVDYFLAVMIFLLAQVLAKSLFSFKVSDRIAVAYSLIFVILEMYGILWGHLSITLTMHVMGMLATIYMASSQHNEYRRYGLLVVLTYSVFSASVSSQILLYLGYFNRSISIPMMFTNQFSALLYIASFLFAVIRTNSLRLKSLQLQQQTFERSILLRGISHDLKLPLSVIKLNTQMRSAYSLSEAEQKHLDATILQATHELEGMTMNINAYLNAISDTQEQGSCRVRECLEEIASRYVYFGIERGIALETQCDEQEHEIPISMLQFDRMIGNLLDNAFKYTSDSGKVILRYAFGKHIVVSVEDTGIGIGSDELGLILNPFYRSDSGRNTKGSGLGLSVVKAVADKLGATLHIDSVLGQGTCVTITIPI